MTLTGLHLLLTYGCTFECDHCFVGSSPRTAGTMTVRQVDDILAQAREAETIEWIWFEGGEPFLYHATLRHGVRRARELGFRVGIVSNAYWALGPEDAREWLRDLAGSVDELSMSCDEFHGDAEQRRRVDVALAAARDVGIPVCTIEIASDDGAARAVGQLPEGESGVMYRGRAAERLAARAPKHPAEGMTACPWEDLREPGRVHVDPFGDLHVCQGIRMGNLFRTPLRALCAAWDPDAHPVVGALLRGGPFELARAHGVATDRAGYADACHLCYATRKALRPRFPAELGPDAMYCVEAAG